MELPWLAGLLITSFVLDTDGYNRLLTFTEPEQYLDICLDGISHKTKPGPESELFEQCVPWKDHSCCTSDVAQQLHVNKTWYKLDYNHCPGRELSPKCRTRFIQDLCFYECSPNVGPWLVKVNGMKIRNERFLEVPLCQTECDAWWEDCMDEYTCVENWSREFNWSTGYPKCPEQSTCRKFSEVYKNSSYFCEKVFDHSWKVVPDNTLTGCFLMWWTGSENPNRRVALEKAQQIVSAAYNTMPCRLCVYVVLVILSVFVSVIDGRIR